LSCEAEASSSSGKLVGDAATRPKTGRLAGEGLDEDLHAFPETQHQVNGALLLDVAVSKGTTILKLLVLVNRELHLEGHDFVVLRGIILLSKGALIRTLVTHLLRLSATGQHYFSLNRATQVTSNQPNEHTYLWWSLHTC
jgi:tRNA U55 pseudouridine synthase TruB